MHLDNQSVCPCSNPCTGQRGNEFPSSGSMTRVYQNGKMRSFFEKRYCTDIKRVTSRTLKRPDSSLAQDQSRISRRKNVFSREEQFLDRGHQSAFQQNRLRLLAYG